MNDAQFGRQIAALLDEGLARVDEDVQTRLQVARKAALGLAARPRHVRALALAGVGGYTGGGLREWFAGPRLWLALGMLALAISGVTLTEFGSDAEADAAAALDLAILADDLPVTAYIDNGFDTWLQRPVEPQQ
ncbi:MAG: DUF3619 family protein [bacterium]